jgi:Lipocalin / cytosolic fatty-acid binding protein family
VNSSCGEPNSHISPLLASVSGVIHILDTNYDTYAVVVACGMMSAKEEGLMVWILSRTSNLDPVIGNKTLDTLRLNRLSPKVVQADRRNCSAAVSGR